MKKVIVVGAAVVDALLKSKGLKVVKGHEVPGGVAICEMIGGKLEAEEGMMVAGGGGTNVGVGLHRLGEAVKIIARLGSDDLADVIIKQLERENLDLSLLQKGEGTTGMSIILVAESGGRSIVTYRGESGILDAKKIDWSSVKKADWIQVSSLGGEISLLEDLAAFAIDNGIRIGVNPGKKELDQREKLLKILPKFDFFNVNRMEASQLVGARYEDEKNMMEKLCEIGPRMIAVTDGKKGASILYNRKWIKMEAFKVDSEDDTGAGDAFVSGVVSGLLQDKKPEEALKMGLANGAAEVMKLGAKNGLLYKNDMEKWMKKKVKMTEEWI